MKNNKQVHIKDELSKVISEYLEYVDGYKIILIADYLNIAYDDKLNYGAILDKILFYSQKSLTHSINILTFINNDYNKDSNNGIINN